MAVSNVSETQSSSTQLKEIYYEGDFVRSILIGDSILQHTKQKEELFNINLIISSSYGQLGSYGEAFNYAQNAYLIAKDLNDTTMLIRANLNKVGCLYFIDDIRAGITTLKDLEIIANRQNDNIFKKDLYDSFSMFYDRLGKKDSAFFYAKKLIELNKKFPELKYYKAIASFLDINKQMELSEAEIDTFFLKTSDLRFPLSSKLTLYKALFRYYITTKQQEKAKIYKDSLENVGILEAGDYHKKVYFWELNNYWLLLGDTSNAYRALFSYEIFDSKIDSTNNKNQILKTEQIIQIESIRSKAAALEKSLQDSNQKLILSITIILITVVLLVVSLILNRIKRKQSKTLRKIADERTKMISILSHDLRSPMVQLSGLLELDVTQDFAKDELKTHLKLIKNNTDNTLLMLENLVKWILDKNSSNKPVHIQSVDLKKLFEELKKELDIVLAKKKIELKFSFEFENIETDFNYLKIILQNLVSNAAKFSYEGSKIILESTVQNGANVISVKDFGKGMTNEQILKFQSGDSFTTRGVNNEKGLGLGSEIIFSSAKKIGIKIKIESELNKGTTFHLIFKQ